MKLHKILKKERQHTIPYKVIDEKERREDQESDNYILNDNLFTYTEYTYNKDNYIPLLHIYSSIVIL